MNKTVQKVTPTASRNLILSKSKTVTLNENTFEVPTISFRYLILFKSKIASDYFPRHTCKLSVPISDQNVIFFL